MLHAASPERMPEELLKAANTLLYRAKAEGRDRLVSRGFHARGWVT